MTALPEGYEPLSDRALEADARWIVATSRDPSAERRILNEALYWRQRAEAAERRIASRCEWCAGDKDIDQPCKNGCDE